MLVTQSSAALCDPIDYSPPGSSVHGILQARILEWVAIPCSRGSSQPRDGIQVSCIAVAFFFFLLSQPLGKQWAITNSSRKNEAAGPKRKQCPVVDMCGGENNVQCYKEQLWRAPKSQLAVEQPLTGECWNPPKTDTHLRRQRRSCSETVAGAQS